MMHPLLPPSDYKVSPDGRKLRRMFEGGPALGSYLCPAGVPTFAWGSTKYVDETGVLQPVQYPQNFTIEDCERADERDEERHADIIRKLVKIPVTQYEFDALASWAYNFGQENIEGSNTLASLNKGDREGFVRYLLKWHKVGREPKRGLYRRRCAEALMFMGLPWEAPTDDSEKKVQLETDFFKELVPEARALVHERAHTVPTRPAPKRPEPAPEPAPEPKRKPRSEHSKRPEEVPYGVEPDGSAKPMEESDRFNGAAEQREGRLYQWVALLLGAPALLLDRFIDVIDRHFDMIILIAAIIGGFGIIRWLFGYYRRKRGEEEATELLY